MERAEEDQRPEVGCDRGLVHLRARSPNLIVSHGETSLVMGADGAIDPDEGHGLFVRETRVLSQHRLHAGGRRPLPVTLSAVRQDQWHGYYLVPAPKSRKDGPAQDPRAAAAREGVELKVVRTVGEGMHEDLCVTNHSERAVDFRLVLQVDADFVGADEAGHAAPRRGRITRRVCDTRDGAVRRWEHRARRKDPRDGRTHALHRVLWLKADRPAEAGGRAGELKFRVRLAPREVWRTCLEWTLQAEGVALPAPPCLHRGPERVHRERSRPAWLERSVAFANAHRGMDGPEVDVVAVLARAQRDLHALRLPGLDREDAWSVAAGIPVYMAPFGRDMLTTGWQSAITGPEIMAGGLEAMARTQGRRRDDWRDEQPGRMLHEARRDPAALLNERPTARYYGSLTSSGLFPLVVADFWDWTGDRERVAPLVEPAIRALRWLDSDALQVPGPFYAVKTRSSKGLDNQTWKDSSESIVDPDGNVVPQPVATCEEQGIVYAAKLRFARVLAALGRRDDADALLRQARELKARFNRSYWMEEAGFVAMALDPRGRPVGSLGSNALRCLASGIVEPELAVRMAERAFRPDLFSGWGIRTLSAEHAAYNPHGYHVGTIWPVEHGPFALGLRRYGLHERCHQLCLAQFELAGLCEGQRLPECVSGHARSAEHPFPAIYPAANSPQAWSASTPLVLVQTMLGLQPSAWQGLLRIDPLLPAWLPELELRRLRVGAASVDLRFVRDDDGRTRFEILHCRGALEVVRQDLSDDAERAWMP